MSPETAIAVSHRAARLENALRKVIRGKDEIFAWPWSRCLHVGILLIEGVPGVGKTTLGQALARALDCTFQRVQFTSDMLPSDVIGISIYSAIEQNLNSNVARFSPTCCWPMKSIAPRQRRNPRCSRP